MTAALKHLSAYVATGLAFLAIDLIWLAVVARDFYHDAYGEILAQPFNLTGAAFFYFIYILGIVIFAVAPALAKRSLPQAAIQGGLFGFFCYAAYNFTALSVIKNFPAAAIPVDLAWGVMLTGSAATGGYLLTTLFFKGGAPRDDRRT